jgi:membrane protein DedA with SNARE-associated domain
MNFENIILDFSYFGIFLLMILNGFISFPSSQLLFIIVGYFVFTGHINPIFAIIVGGVGNAIGNIFLYEVSRKKGLKYILKFKIFPKNQIKKVQIAFNKKGPIFLFIAKLLPALKVFVPIPAGISKMNRVLFFLIVWITSTIWVTIFLLLGYFF